MSNYRISRQEVFWITLACLAYFLILLGSRVLNVPDEGRYSEVAREMLLSGDFITPKLNGVAFFHKPILYYWLQAASFSVFGISEWSVRLFPSLFGVLGCVLTYIAGTWIAGRRAGVLATVILATNPLYFLSAHYADMNLEVAVLISGSLLCFLVAMQRPYGPRRRNILWLAYAFAALAVLTKGLIGIVFPMMVIGAWIVLSRRWRTLREMYMVSGLLIFLAITLPWYVAVQLKNPGFFDFFFIFQQFTRFTSTGFNNALPLWFYPAVLFLGFFPWSVPFLFTLGEAIADIWRKTDTGRRDLFLWLWLLLILIFFSIPESKIVGYILPVLPAMALLTGAYLDRRLRALAENPGRIRAFFGTAAMALLFGLAMLLTINRLPEKQVVLGVKPYYLATAAVLLAGAFSMFILTLRRKSQLAVVAVAVSGALTCFALLEVSIPVSSADSVKPLALMLKQRLQPGDRVISYEEYYQDLGIYLGLPDPVMVVTDWQDQEIPKSDNWRSEFYFGFPASVGEEQWMVNEKGFADSLGDHKTTYVFCSTEYVPKLERRYDLQLLAQRNRTALLATASGAGDS